MTHNVERIEQVLRGLTGQNCNVRVESGVEPPRATAGEVGQRSASRYRRLREDAFKEPVIKRAIELLGAQIVDIEDGFGEAPSSEATSGGEEL